MIEDPDQAPRPPSAQRFIPPPTLEGWGVAELRAYVAALQAEIGRAEAAIARQETHRSAADAFFRKP
jgi:uncharacterized small protein (DUF1192 family)